MNTRPLQWLARGTVVTVSLMLGLVLAEQAARLVRGDAWAFLNIFEPDARYGVVLHPGATTRLRSRGGVITTVAVNRQGFRGPDWERLPQDGRVLVLGDSQMFGYGVEEEDATAQQLTRVSGGRLTGLAAAVPTWGPMESVLAAQELIPRFRPAHVVFVANLTNDWFEAPVPNTRRTTAVDGWTTRVLVNAPAAVDFPFRSWLSRHSQLFHALRTVSQVRTVTGPPLAEAPTRLRSELATLSTGTPPHRSRLTPHVLGVEQVCRRHGCSVTVALLPLDVQADPGAWRKYRGAPQDLEPLSVLTNALREDAATHGIAVVDLLPALRAVSPGAFLPDDDHLSPRGHHAVATALDRHFSTSLAEVFP